MAREIVVRRGEHESRFSFSKIDRSKLYGRRRRVPLDPDDQRCERASLTADGSLLIRRGMVAQGYFDSVGTWVPDKELVPVNEEGEELPVQPSTLGEAQEAEAVGPEALLDLRIFSVYSLAEAEVEEELVAALRAGEFFRVPFVYRAGPGGDVAVLVANADGELFALVGTPTTPEWQSPDERVPTYEESDDDDDDDLDLDFEMF